LPEAVEVVGIIGVDGRVAPRVQDVLAVAVERQIELERLREEELSSGTD